MTVELEGFWRMLSLIDEEKDNVITEGILNSEISDEERVTKEYEVSVLDSNLFLFKFRSERDKDRVLEGAPCSFNNHLLMFHGYDGNLRPSEYVFNKGSFWIRVYDLPLNLMSLDIVERIGNKVGVLQKIDQNPTRLGWAGNLCLLVEINITKPLRRFVTILKRRGKDNDSGGSGVLANVGADEYFEERDARLVAKCKDSGAQSFSTMEKGSDSESFGKGSCGDTQRKLAANTLHVRDPIRSEENFDNSGLDIDVGENNRFSWIKLARIKTVRNVGSSKFVLGKRNSDVAYIEVPKLTDGGHKQSHFQSVLTVANEEVGDLVKSDIVGVGSQESSVVEVFDDKCNNVVSTEAGSQPC
ncbi:hypothetical protein PTKIN_Ptkin06aG0130800 [Pterospermum kingtungense]